MTPTITAFAASPDRGRGLARDMRVRWACEEVGLAYDTRLVSFAELRGPAHRALNPFGQIPTWEEDGLGLFESGAIVLHVAENHPGLLPPDATARARAKAWIFAAIDTVEPPIVDLSIAGIVEREKPWHGLRLPMLEERVRTRLAELGDWLGGRDWLEGAFTAGDLMMVTVLRRAPTTLLAEQPIVADYVARGEARPAFRRAFAAQKTVFDMAAQSDGGPQD
jgi:glutathione S-transferase